MKKTLSLLIIALCLIIVTTTSNAGNQSANLHLFIRDTLPLNDTENQHLRKDTFGGLKDVLDSNKLKAKSDSLHKHPPKN